MTQHIVVEVEITDEMVQAGLAAIESLYPDGFNPSAEEIVKEIFTRMVELSDLATRHRVIGAANSDG